MECYWGLHCQVSILKLGLGYREISAVEDMSMNQSYL